MARLIAVVCTLSMFLLAALAQPKTIRVPQDHTTIQAAINAAVNGDTVLVAEGTYLVHLKITKKIVLASHFILDGDTTHISRTILDGNGASHPDSGAVMLLDTGTDTTTVVTGFTITRGRGMKITWSGVNARYGGGITVEGRAGATIRRNIISGNTSVAPSGGYGGAAGISVTSGDLLIRPQPVIIEDNIIESNTVTPTDASSGTEVAGIGFWGGNGRICRNIIRNNRVYWANTSTSWMLGGGALIGTDGSMPVYVTFADNLVEGNRTYRGGGLGVYGGATVATVRNNVFLDNTADYFGGGLGLYSGVANSIISGNYFARNSSARGGGIAAYNTGSNTIVNNIIVNNISTAQSGAGIRLYNCSDVRIVNNTLAYNVGGTSDGLDIQDGPVFLTPNKVLNCIIWGTTSSAISMQYPGQHAIRNCIVRGGWASGTNIYDIDPWFVAGDTLFHPDQTPGHLSPVYGRGVASANMGGITVNAPSTDYFGAPRPALPGSNPDLGAIEYVLIDRVEELPVLPPFTFALDQNHPNPFNPSTTIRFTLPHVGHVRLTIYNLLGQMVDELVNERLNSGVKQVTWTATGPSGVYLYTLEADDGAGHRFRETKRMILLK